MKEAKGRPKRLAGLRNIVAFPKVYNTKCSLASPSEEYNHCVEEMSVLTVPSNDFNKRGLHVKNLLPSADWLLFAYEYPVLSIEMS